eukprot:scaffold355956_cov42-Attheya_sp.AAC.1
MTAVLAVATARKTCCTFSPARLPTLTGLHHGLPWWINGVSKILPPLAYLTPSIKLQLDHWRKSLPAPDLAFYPKNLRLAILAQSKIGWQNFLDGFVAHQWDVVQSGILRTNKQPAITKSLACRPDSSD